MNDGSSKVIQQRKKVTRSCILQAASELLVELGYTKATTNRIADRAGYSIGTLYQYFTNKGEIFSCLMHNNLEPTVESIRSFIPKKNIRDSIEAVLIQSRSSISNRDPKLWHALELIPGGEFTNLRYESRKKTIVAIEALLQHHRGEIIVPNLSLAAHLMVGALEGIAFSVDEVTFNSPEFNSECVHLLHAYFTCETTT